LSTGWGRFRVVRDPSIVSPSLTGVFIGGGHNKHGTGSRCTLQKQCRPPSPSSHQEPPAARTCQNNKISLSLVTFQVCGVLSGVRVDGGVCASSRHPESRLGGRLWHRSRGPQLTSYLKILRAGSGLRCRPELRNHGVGWVRAVERLRNGGVLRNPVFLMPATHCS